MNELIDTTEMYLRTIYELGEEGTEPLRARIAERLEQSVPTVSQTVARMERDGLLSVDSGRRLVLTERGMALARRVMRRHRLAECLLNDVIGLEWHLVHDEACRWEHVISTDVERRLVDILGQPTLSPYGDPIPALDELGADESGVGFLDGARPLSEALRGSSSQVACLVRIGESLQAHATMLRMINDAGVRPGTTVEAILDADHLDVSAGRGHASLPVAAATQLFVASASAG